MAKGRKKRKKDLSHRRVFILGAGASASCGIAVARDILQEAVIRLGRRDATKKKLVDDLLSYLYPGFNADLKNYPNIEDFLNLLEMAKSFNSEEFIESSLWSKARLESVKDVTMKAVTDYLWERIEKGDALNPMKLFAVKCLKWKDTVVTFNWDVTLERGLWDREDDFRMPYTYRRKRDGKFIAILKPHGSIDWFRLADLSKKVIGKTETLDEELVSTFQLRQTSGTRQSSARYCSSCCLKNVRVRMPKEDLAFDLSCRCGCDRTLHYWLFFAKRGSIRPSGAEARLAFESAANDEGRKRPGPNHGGQSRREYGCDI
jgi:hypothetical protein